MENVSKINRVNGKLLSVAEMVKITGGGFQPCNPGSCQGQCTEYLTDPKGRIDRYNGICQFNRDDGSCVCARLDE